MLNATAFRRTAYSRGVTAKDNADDSTDLYVLFVENLNSDDASSVRGYLRECTTSPVYRVARRFGDRQKTQPSSSSFLCTSSQIIFIIIIIIFVIHGDAEFAGVENAGVEIAGKGKLWKANMLTICC